MAVLIMKKNKMNKQVCQKCKKYSTDLRSMLEAHHCELDGDYHTLYSFVRTAVPEKCPYKLEHLIMEQEDGEQRSV